MPKTWTTSEQKKWLKLRVNDFINSQKSGASGKWLTQMREAWFVEFPEIKNCFPDKVDPLTDEEKKIYDNAVETRKAQLENWFHYHSKIGKSSRRAAGISQFLKWITSVTKDAKRAPQERHVYCEMYPDKVNELYKERAEDLPKAIERCNLKGAIAAELYNKEPEDVRVKVKEEVALRKARQQEEIKKKAAAFAGEEKRLPEDYQRAIDDMGGVIGACMEALVQATGWTFVLLAGGPMPMNNGALYTEEYHFGEVTGEGKVDFSDAHPKYTEHVKDPFSDYINRCYSANACIERALNSETESPKSDKEQPEQPHREIQAKNFKGMISMPNEEKSSPTPTSVPSGSSGNSDPGDSDSELDEPEHTLPEQDSSDSEHAPPDNLDSALPNVSEATAVATYSKPPAESPIRSSTPLPLARRRDGPTSPIENAFARMANRADETRGGNVDAVSSMGSVIRDSPGDDVIDPALLETPAPSQSQALNAFSAGFIFKPLDSSGLRPTNDGELEEPPESPALDYTINGAVVPHPRTANVSSTVPAPTMLNNLSVSKVMPKKIVNAPHIEKEAVSNPRKGRGKRAKRPVNSEARSGTNDGSEEVLVAVAKTGGTKRSAPDDVGTDERPRRKIKAPVRPDGRLLSPEKVAKRGTRGV